MLVGWVRLALQLTLPFLFRLSSSFFLHTTCGLLLYLLCASPVSFLSPREKWVNEWDPFLAFVLLSLPPLFFRFARKYLVSFYACGS